MQVCYCQGEFVNTIWKRLMSDMESFRNETRSWLEVNCPASMRLPEKEEDMIYYPEYIITKSEIYLKNNIEGSIILNLEFRLLKKKKSSGCN